MGDEPNTVDHVSAYFLPHGSVREPLSLLSEGLSHHSKSTILRNSLVEAFLHGCYVRVAVQNEIGIAFAGQQVLLRCWQYVIFILPQGEFPGAPTLGNVPHGSAMETDIVRSFQIDR